MKQSSIGNNDSFTGVWIGSIIILLWGGSLYVFLTFQIDFTSILTYVGVLLQTHLFTGLFITAHDAMHGSVAPSNPRLNQAIGKLCTTLFLFNSYHILRPKHYQHHKHVGTNMDPDFHKGNPGFWQWYFDFLKEYITWKQLLLAAISFHLAQLLVPQLNLILYWVIPSVLSTFQLFYFGTYLPHKGEHHEANIHKSRSQSKNHFWAFISCYFFGYHYEHHDAPRTPWWRLWRLKVSTRLPTTGQV